MCARCSRRERGTSSLAVPVRAAHGTRTGTTTRLTRHQEGYTFDSQELDGVRVALLAADGFEQGEVTRPVQALEKR